MWLVSAWLANNVPTWLLLLGLSVLIAGGAVLIQVYVRRRFPGLKEDAHNDVMRTLGQRPRPAAMQQAKSLTVFDKADSDGFGRACWSVYARPTPSGP